MSSVEILPASEIRWDLDAVIARSSVAAIPHAAKIMKKAIKNANYCWLLLIHDEIACVYGLHTFSLLSQRAYLWALTTDVVEEHKFIFIRQSRIVIEALLKDYELIGETHRDDLKAQRWLQWLGAEYEFPSGDLIPFRITKNGSGKHRRNGSR